MQHVKKQVYSECPDIICVNTIKNVVNTTIKNIFINAIRKQHLIHHKSINNGFFGFETS